MTPQPSGPSPSGSRRPGTIEQRLRHGPPALLDGAMGTELERRGISTELPLWSARALLDAPATVLEIHTEYVLAGAEILTANTFRTNPRALARAGLGDRDALLTARAVELAREAARLAGRRVWVAGSAAPVEDCYRPERVPSDFELELEHARHMRNLRAADVDFVLIETMNTAREAAVALRAAQDVKLRAGVSFVLRDAQHLLGGHPLEATVDALAGLGPIFLGLNCNTPELSTSALLRLRRYWGGPIAVYGNLGHIDAASGLRRGETHSDQHRYRAAAREWARHGARIIGGCCGTTPALLAAVRRDRGAAAVAGGEGASS